MDPFRARIHYVLQDEVLTRNPVTHRCIILRSIPDAINKNQEAIKHIRRQKILRSGCFPTQEALRKIGFTCNLSYNPQPLKPKRHRNRNAIWFYLAPQCQCSRYWSQIPTSCRRRMLSDQPPLM